MLFLAKDMHGYALTLEKWKTEQISREFDDFFKRFEEQLKESHFSSFDLYLRLLNSAQKYIHFLTFSVDTTLLAALRLISFPKLHIRQDESYDINYRCVTVRGVIGKQYSSNDYVGAMLQNCPLSSTWQVHNPKRSKPNHTKLVVIDGLVAIEGAANLTLNSIVNAGENIPTTESALLQTQKRFKD